MFTLGTYGSTVVVVAILNIQVIIFELKAGRVGVGYVFYTLNLLCRLIWPTSFVHFLRGRSFWKVALVKGQSVLQNQHNISANVRVSRAGVNFSIRQWPFAFNIDDNSIGDLANPCLREPNRYLYSNMHQSSSLSTSMSMSSPPSSSSVST
jgi:hypothetical protein